MVTSRSCIAWELVSKEDDVDSGMAELAKEVVMEGEGGGGLIDTCSDVIGKSKEPHPRNYT